MLFLKAQAILKARYAAEPRAVAVLVLGVSSSGVWCDVMRHTIYCIALRLVWQVVSQLMRKNSISSKKERPTPQMEKLYLRRPHPLIVVISSLNTQMGSAEQIPNFVQFAVYLCFLKCKADCRQILKIMRMLCKKSVPFRTT